MRPIRGWHRLLAAAALGAAASAGAQADPPPQGATRLELGSRVRVSTVAPGEGGIRLVTGRLEAAHGDTLVLRPSPADAPIVVPLDPLSIVQVYRRGEAAQLHAAALGTVGVLTGAGLYLKWCVDNRDECRRDGVDENPHDSVEVVSLLQVMVVGTGLLGAALGYALTPPQWEAVKLPVRLAIAPHRRGVVIGASAAFGGRRSARPADPAPSRGVR